MADFINTIDAVGDEAVIDSIIDRTITEFKDDRLTTVGISAFRGCNTLTEVDLPTCNSIDTHAFNACIGLRSARLPSCVKLGNEAFRGCRTLASIDIPAIESIGQYSLANTVIESITLPTLTSFTGGFAFRWCSKLKYVDLPVVSTIPTGTFDSTASLIALILRKADATVTLDVNAFAFGGGTSAIHEGRGYIYVPAALIEDYKVATNWSAYADQFRALEDYTVDGTVTGELDETKI